MKTLLRSILVASLCTAGLTLSACGGGSNEGDTPGANNAGSNSGTQAANSASNASVENQEVADAALGLVEKFVGHVANREFAEALEMVEDGGGAEDLQGYIIALENPAFANVVSGIIDDAVAPFANAGVEITEATDDSAVARLSMGDQNHDLELTTVDGNNWLIEFPKGVMQPWESMMNAAPQP